MFLLLNVVLFYLYRSIMRYDKVLHVFIPESKFCKILQHVLVYYLQYKQLLYTWHVSIQTETVILSTWHVSIQTTVILSTWHVSIQTTTVIHLACIYTNNCYTQHLTCLGIWRCPLHV